ncbi:MAG: hypothetical protein AAGI68_07775 [Planctomycetota bacterium]
MMALSEAATGQPAVVFEPGARPPAATEPGVHPTPGPIIWFNIGGSSNRPNRRSVGWLGPGGSWDLFVQTQVRPLLSQGARRVMLHNPFGHEPDTSMQFDQAVHALDAQTHWLTTGFVTAWHPVVRGDYTDGQPVEVICYLGKLHDDPDFKPSNPLHEPAPFWLARAWQSLRPPLEAGMSIAMDASSNAPEDSPQHRLIQMLRSLGVTVYVEARPYKNRPHLFGMPVISRDDFWSTSDPAKNPGARPLYARNDQLRGEIIRILLPLPQTAEEARRRIHKIQRDGHTPALLMPTLNALGIRNRELLENTPPPAPDPDQAPAPAASQPGS